VRVAFKAVLFKHDVMLTVVNSFSHFCWPVYTIGYVHRCKLNASFEMNFLVVVTKSKY
jgi:hypothetical protein